MYPKTPPLGRAHESVLPGSVAPPEPYALLQPWSPTQPPTCYGTHTPEPEKCLKSPLALNLLLATGNKPSFKISASLVMLSRISCFKSTGLRIRYRSARAPQKWMAGASNQAEPDANVAHFSRKRLDKDMAYGDRNIPRMHTLFRYLSTCNIEQTWLKLVLPHQ